MASKKNIYRMLTSLFLLLLILPCFGLLREKRNIDLIAEMENRAIHPGPNSVFGTKAFFREFQNWFEDRILGRKDLIRFWSTVNGKLFHVLISKEVAMGRSGYLYYPSYVTETMSDRMQKLNRISGIKKLCDKYNIPFVFFMVPHGEWMLSEFLPDKQKPADVKKLESELKSDLQKRGISYCMFGTKLNRLPAEERKNMYVWGDYHWNSKGAFLGAKELLHELQLNKLIDDSNLYEEEEKNRGEVYTRKIGWDAIETVAKIPWSNAWTTEFSVQSHEGSKYIPGEGNSQKGEIIFRNPRASHNITMLVLGDSFFGKLQKYLSQDIETIVLCHNMDIARPKESIDLERLLQTYKPDIVVYEKMGGIFFSESCYSNFKNWK